MWTLSLETELRCELEKSLLEFSFVIQVHIIVLKYTFSFSRDVHPWSATHLHNVFCGITYECHIVGHSLCHHTWNGRQWLSVWHIYTGHCVLPFPTANSSPLSTQCSTPPNHLNLVPRRGAHIMSFYSVAVVSVTLNTRGIGMNLWVQFLFSSILYYLIPIWYSAMLLVDLQVHNLILFDGHRRYHVQSFWLPSCRAHSKDFSWCH